MGDMGRRRTLAIALALAATAPLSAGCLSRDPLIVALSAPKAASGMTLFLVTEPSLLDKLDATSKSAEYAIYYGNQLAYPPGGRGASFTMDGRAGSVFIPYDRFVVGNGDYSVVVRYGGAQVTAQATVEKWVDYVFLHPFDKGSAIVVEAALASATGGSPEDTVLAEGELVLALHYHGADGTDDRTVGSVSASTRHDFTSTDVEVAKSRFSQGPGYYSFEPTFHNLEARNNVQVPGDPTMAYRSPPWNWIYVSA
jgi:hypothetical protein